MKILNKINLKKIKKFDKLLFIGNDGNKCCELIKQLIVTKDFNPSKTYVYAGNYLYRDLELRHKLLYSVKESFGFVMNINELVLRDNIYYSFDYIFIMNDTLICKEHNEYFSGKCIVL